MIDARPCIIFDAPEHEGDIEAIVTRAIEETQGRDRYILVISERDLGSSFPEGTRLFVVESKSTMCHHNPRCTWYDSVFHGNARCVVVAMNRGYDVSPETVIHCLAEIDAMP